MTVVAVVLWGRRAAVPAATFGGVATLLQLVAARAMARTGVPAAVDHPRIFAAGMLLRMLGVVVLGVVVSRDPVAFPPLPSALGYLGTVLSLLFLETRLER